MTGSVHEAARGAEVLLLDRDDRVREGLNKLLTGVGVIVTATDDAERALELAQEKFFAAAVVDVDTPFPDDGFSIMERLKKRSPATSVILLAGRQTFELAARGFRAGAVDVVAKEPAGVRYLLQTVGEVCGREIEADEREQLLGEILQLLEQFLERLMSAYRRAVAAEDALSGYGDSLAEGCKIILVDDNPRNGPGLQQALGDGAGYTVYSAVTGGEALDLATSQRFHLAIVKNDLPDLPSSMVVTSLRAEVPDGIVILFTPPTDTPGRMDIIEGSRTIELVPSLESGEQMVQAIHELREAHRAKARERRYLRAFREENYDFLRHFVETKQNLSVFIENAKQRTKHR